MHNIYPCEGIKYKCDQCDHATTDRSNLRKHIASKHGGATHSCNQCDYTTTDRTMLKLHKASKHEGVKYPCNLCHHIANTDGSLRAHKAAKHSGKRFPCELCDYTAAEKAKLKRHKAFKHKETFLEIEMGTSDRVKLEPDEPESEPLYDPFISPQTMLEFKMESDEDKEFESQKQEQEPQDHFSSETLLALKTEPPESKIDPLFIDNQSSLNEDCNTKEAESV